LNIATVIAGGRLLLVHTAANGKQLSPTVCNVQTTTHHNHIQHFD